MEFFVPYVWTLVLQWNTKVVIYGRGGGGIFFWAQKESISGRKRNAISGRKRNAISGRKRNAISGAKEVDFWAQKKSISGRKKAISGR